MILTLTVAIIALGYLAAFAAGLLVGYQAFKIGKDGLVTPVISLSGRRKEKRKPKFISEEEQWKREQKRPPLDPGLEG